MSILLAFLLVYDSSVLLLSNYWEIPDWPDIKQIMTRNNAYFLTTLEMKTQL
jgi:hypothetical protein